MDFTLDRAAQDAQAEARDLAAVVAPLAVEADGMSTLHMGVLDALRDSRLCELTVPAQWGGRHAEVDPVAVCVAREVLMATSSHLDSLFALQGIGSYAISRAGTDEQQAHWLPRVATAEVLAGLALTEPEAGSDLRGMETTVTAEGDSLVVDGPKSWISNGGVAGFYTVLGREALGDGGEGMSLILVPADAAGVSTGPTPEIIAPHVLGEVTLDGVRLGADARIGQPGEGLSHVLATLAVFRVSVAGAAVGLAQRALEEATRHAATREQFGRPLARLGAVASLLADSWADVEQARLITYRAAHLAREDPAAALPHSSMAKLAASEAAGRVVDRCVQVMGRWGLVKDSQIERLYRQARPMRIYEGASEVLRLGIANGLVDEVMSGRGSVGEASGGGPA